MNKCKISRCQEKHHARGYCKRHYMKLRAYGDPTAGKEDPRPPEERKRGPRDPQQAQSVLISAKELQQPQAQPDTTPPEPRKKRVSGQGNYMFFLNQKTIERLYKEAEKSQKEPLYRANDFLYTDFLALCLKLAGYQESSRLITAHLIDELKTWADCRDRYNFMNTLINWEQRAAEYKPQKPQQLNLFNIK